MTPERNIQEILHLLDQQVLIEQRLFREAEECKDDRFDCGYHQGRMIAFDTAATELRELQSSAMTDDEEFGVLGK